MSNPENGPQLPAIRWPVPKNNRGGEFSNLEEMLAHLEMAEQRKSHRYVAVMA
ncbi:hypothetical protein AB9P26_000395 [Salmonella enterica]